MKRMTFDEEDTFKKFHQTQKFYKELRNFYKKRITIDTPFVLVAVNINYAINHFDTDHYGHKIRQKVIYLSFKYLDEIGYKIESSNTYIKGDQHEAHETSRDSTE